MSLNVGIAQYLGEHSSLTYSETEESQIFVDQMPEDGELLACVYAEGGYEPDSKLPYDPGIVEVVVRGDMNPVTALTLWDEVYSLLHGLRNVTLPNGDYLVWAIAQQGSPNRLGTDEAGRHRYSLNLRCEVLRT